MQIPNTSNTQPKLQSLPADSKSTTPTVTTATPQAKYGTPIVFQPWPTSSTESSVMSPMPGGRRQVGYEEERKARPQLRYTYRSPNRRLLRSSEMTSIGDGSVVMAGGRIRRRSCRLFFCVFFCSANDWVNPVYLR